MPDLDEFALSKLARELAMNIRNYKLVFADFNITEEDYYEIEKIDFFRRAKEQYTLEWNSALSAADRVKLVSAAYVEATLPTIGRRMLNENEPLSNVIDAGKFLARNAGIGEPKNGFAQSDRFIIQLNIGNDSNGKEIVEIYNKSIAVSTNDVNDTISQSCDITPPAPATPEAAALKAITTPDPEPEPPAINLGAFAAFEQEDDHGQVDSQTTAEPASVFIRTPRKRGRPKGSRNRVLPHK
jgi:hypothetical protein